MIKLGPGQTRLELAAADNDEFDLCSAPARLLMAGVDECARAASRHFSLLEPEVPKRAPLCWSIGPRWLSGFDKFQRGPEFTWPCIFGWSKQRRRRRFPKERAVDPRETPEPPETVIGSDISHSRLLGVRPLQRPPRQVHSSQQQIPFRTHAEILLTAPTQRWIGDPRRCTELRNV